MMAMSEPGILWVSLGERGDNGHADYTHGGGPYVQAAEVADVHDPFL